MRLLESLSPESKHAQRVINVPPDHIAGTVLVGAFLSSSSSSYLCSFVPLFLRNPEEKTGKDAKIRNTANQVVGSVGWLDRPTTMEEWWSIQSKPNRDESRTLHILRHYYR